MHTSIKHHHIVHTTSKLANAILIQYNNLHILTKTCYPLNYHCTGVNRYLAPEYAQSGEVTEKADVYSFGVVLLELVTGRKAVDLAQPKGQQCLTEWVHTCFGFFFLVEKF